MGPGDLHGANASLVTWRESICQDLVAEKGSHCHSFKQKQNLYQVLTNPPRSSSLWGNQTGLTRPTDTAELSNTLLWLWSKGWETTIIAGSVASCSQWNLSRQSPASPDHTGWQQDSSPPCNCSCMQLPGATRGTCTPGCEPSEVADAPLGGWPGCGENAMAIAGRVGLWTQFQLMPGWWMVTVWGLGLYLLRSQAAWLGPGHPSSQCK